jgi:peptidyl-prolyl cis-trans isomerase C
MAVTVTACGSSSGTNSAVISGKLAPTNEKELEAELKMMTAIPAFTAGWKKGSQEHQDARTGKKYAPELVAYVLQSRFFNSLIQEEAKARKLKPAKVTAEMKANTANAIPGGETAFNAYPQAYRDNLLLTQQNIEALLLDARGDPKTYFEKNKDTFSTPCIRHILVKTEPEALTAIKRIKGGEEFAKVAAELSDDPGSKDNGGELGCQPLSGYVPEFANAGAELKVGELSAPVQSQFGFHVMQVTKRDEPKWGPEVEAQSKQAAQQAGVEEIKAALIKRVKDAGTKVNPKFGVLNTEAPIPQIDRRPDPGATTLPASPELPAPGAPTLPAPPQN